MKMIRIARPLATITLMLSALTLATPGFAAEPLSPCKQDCLNQHQGNVETLLRERPAPGVDPLLRRETVLAAIDALSSCVKTCDLTPAPTPIPVAEPAPAPAPRPSKKR